jgi:hypothetical protein
MAPPPAIPRSGAFATSEVLPILQQASAEMRARRREWQEARTAANEAKAHARKVRADLIVYLRVWGTEETGGIPIKTSAERNEWADADANVQQAELEADLAQTVQMSARAAWEEAQAYFNTIQTMLGMERDEFKFERGGRGE